MRIVETERHLHGKELRIYVRNVNSVSKNLSQKNRTIKLMVDGKDRL